MPIGILSSLGICTVLYILVSIVLVGIVPYRELNVAHPMAVATQRLGYHWLTLIVEIGATVSLTSVLFGLLVL